MPIDPLIPRDPLAEYLLAVMDVGSILEAGAKVRLNQEMRERAGRMPAKIQTEIRGFLAASEFEAERELPEFDYSTAMKLLTGLDPQQRIEALAMAVPEGDDAGGVIVVAGRAIKYLKDILPTKSRLLMTGPEAVEPNDLVKYRFRRAYQVVEDPMGLFADMREGALCRDQVRTLQAVYPSVYDDAERALVLELARLKGDRPTLQLSRPKVRQIENLLLTRSWTPELARVMQEAFRTKDKPEGRAPQGSGLSDKSIEQSASPIQRVANR